MRPDQVVEANQEETRPLKQITKKKLQVRESEKSGLEEPKFSSSRGHAASWTRLSGLLLLLLEEGEEGEEEVFDVGGVGKHRDSALGKLCLLCAACLVAGFVGRGIVALLTLNLGD